MPEAAYSIRRTIAAHCEHEDCQAPVTEVLVLAQDDEEGTQLHIGFFCLSHGRALEALVEESMDDAPN